MARSNPDFAHPVVKTIGCFVAISALPLVLILGATALSPAHPAICATCAVVTLAGLATLVGKPTLLHAALHAATKIGSRPMSDKSKPENPTLFISRGGTARTRRPPP